MPTATTIKAYYGTDYVDGPSLTVDQRIRRERFEIPDEFKAVVRAHLIDEGGRDGECVQMQGAVDTRHARLPLDAPARGPPPGSILAGTLDRSRAPPRPSAASTSGWSSPRSAPLAGSRREPACS